MQPRERRTAKEKGKMSSQGISGRTLLFKFTSPQHSYADALRQDKQLQEPEATQTEQQYLPQKEFQKSGLSVQAPSSSANDTVAPVVHQIMIELSKAV
jgi:hypothetical protein